MIFANSLASRIFLFLLVNQGDCCQYRAIAQKVYGNDCPSGWYKNLTCQVTRLRNMGVPIATVRNKGYLLSEKYTEAQIETLDLLREPDPFELELDESLVESHVERFAEPVATMDHKGKLRPLMDKVIGFIRKNPGVSGKKIAQALSMNENLVNAHIGNARKFGIKVQNEFRQTGVSGYTVHALGLLDSGFRFLTVNVSEKKSS